MNYSKRVSNIKISLTSNTRVLSKKLIQEGHDVVNLASGELVSGPPILLKNNLIKNVDKNTQLYTDAAGDYEVRKAVSSYATKHFCFNGGAENILLTNGAKSALFLVFMSLLDEGDEVLLPSPCWGTFEEQLNILGAKVTKVDLSENNFQIDFDNLKKKVSDDTKLIVVNSPCNPTGKVINWKELKALTEYASRNKIYVIIDASYNRFLFNSDISCYLDETIFSKNVILIDSLSKTFGVTGWRFGYVAANRDLIKKLRSVVSHTSSNMNSLVQYSFCNVLTDQLDDFVYSNRAIMRSNKDYILERFEEVNGVEAIIPDGGFFTFLRISFDNQPNSKYGNGTELVEGILREVKVSVTPGAAFGYENGFRVSLCVEPILFKRGVERIISFFDRFSI